MRAKIKTRLQRMSVAERDKFLAELKPLVNRGDYEAAHSLTKAMFRRYPADFTVRYQHAKLLGDWADELPLKKQANFKGQAVAILRPLLKALRSRPVDERFGVCLNYYYQSKNWRGMLAFARRASKNNPQKSLYGQGLARTLMAADLLSGGAEQASIRWALKAVGDWKRYRLQDEAYYFPHYCFAKALALSGDPVSSMARLRIAAKLGRRKVSDWEFADVVSLCKTAASKNH